MVTDSSLFCSLCDHSFRGHQKLHRKLHLLLQIPCRRRKKEKKKEKSGNKPRRSFFMVKKKTKKKKISTNLVEDGNILIKSFGSWLRMKRTKPLDSNTYSGVFEEYNILIAVSIVLMNLCRYSGYADSHCSSRNREF